MIFHYCMLATACIIVHAQNSEEHKANNFVKEAESALEAQTEIFAFSEWAFSTNITEENEKTRNKDETALKKLIGKYGKEAKKYDLNKLTDPDVKRKMELLTRVGTSALGDDKLTELTNITSKMVSTYSTATVLDYKRKAKNYTLDKIEQIFKRSNDSDELKYYWENWREASGKRIKEKYEAYVELNNKAAQIVGFKDASDMKVEDFESDTFKQDVEDAWIGFKPLYEQLHAYVRNKLQKVYGDSLVTSSGAIPAHLLGNMWAQSWASIAHILIPYPDKSSINVTVEMVKQGWTHKTMFQKAERFFESMGLDKMPNSFWSESMLVKPTDGRKVVCHASAWDFANRKDFRIKMCTKVNQEDFVTVNHEMGHIEYYLQYKELSYLFRNGANPGFHEAVADILSLAVGTASHFKRLRLIGDNVNTTDPETDINILFTMALRKIAFLPFGYLIDKFRWDVYSGKTSVENMNCHWWKLRHEIQGVRPPSKRSYKDFDPGAKYHVASDAGYIRYFTAHVYNFQFFRELCLVSGKYVPGDPNKPLHRCNFYGSREAGDKLKEMLKLGSSKPWRFAMETITGQRLMSSEAMRVYFQPLEDWLKAENKKSGISIGWGAAKMAEICEEYKPGKPGNGSKAVKVNSICFALVIFIVFL